MSKTNVIYEFKCICSETYVGRTSQKLETRIGQHIPVWLSKGKVRASESAIALHLIKTQHKVDPATAFSIITSTKKPFMLPILEALKIRSLSPVLCRQKQFVRQLRLS